MNETKFPKDGRNYTWDDIEIPVMEGYKIKRTGIRYWGSKIHALPLLLSYFPEPKKEMVFADIFTGSGVVPVNYGVKSNIMNDKDNLLYSFFKVVGGIRFLKSHKNYQDIGNYVNFVTELEFTVRGQVWFDDLVKRTDIVGKALLFIMLNTNNFSGKVDLEEKNPFHPSIPRNIPMEVHLDLLKFFRKTDTRVWNYDFRKALDRCMSKKEIDRFPMFIYLDPPYLDDGRNLYSKDWSKRDLIDLLTYCEDLEHHWIMSNEDTEFVRELFKDFYIKEVRWQYHGSKSRKVTRDKGKPELLISNQRFRKRSLGSDLVDMKKLDEWIK